MKAGRRPVDLPVEKILRLHNEGMSLATLSRRFGVAPSTIRERLKTEADHEQGNDATHPDA